MNFIISNFNSIEQKYSKLINFLLSLSLTPNTLYFLLPQLLIVLKDFWF